MLNLNGSLTKAGVRYSTIWSETFEDEFARQAAWRSGWPRGASITTRATRGRSTSGRCGDELRRAAVRGAALGRQLRARQAIMGIFDEGCMGMYNAIIPDDLLHATGVFKERLSQSALYAAMREVSDETAAHHYAWLRQRGMTFALGPDPAADLTEAQVLEGLKMYDAAVRMAADFGCAAIGIQYQQGLKDVCVASDLAEGLLNTPDRPPVLGRRRRRALRRPGRPALQRGRRVRGPRRAPHEPRLDGRGPRPVDHAARRALGRALRGPRRERVRLGVRDLRRRAAEPPRRRLRGARGERQPPMYFPKGGATIKGISRPGEIVWSRVYVEGDALHMDIGRGGALRLPEEETERRWEATTSQWPMMHAVLYGVTRDQFMAKHKANHIQVVYAPDAPAARRLLAAKAGMADALGIRVNLCGDLEDELGAHQAEEFRV